jgi:Spy/CpxP family protein refolding chaperone
MKISKIAVITAIAVSSLVTFRAAAQDKPPGEGNGPHKEHPQPGARADKVATELGLSADQKAKWEAAMKAQFEQMKAIREDASLTPEQKREKARAVREETDKGIKEILTPEQYAKLQKMRQDRREHPAAPRPQPPQNPPK